MVKFVHLQKILLRLERASASVCRKFPDEKYVMPIKKDINLTENEIMKQINNHISFLENREYSYMLFKKQYKND